MARRLPGTSGNYLQFSAGNLAGVTNHGTIAVLFKRVTLTTSVAWQCPIYSGSAGAWSLSLDITEFNQMWVGISGQNEAYSSGAWANTADWFVVVVTVSATVHKPEYHWYNLSTGVWTHETTFTNWNGTATNSIDKIILGSFDGGDLWNGDIAAAAIYKDWVPTSAQVEALGLHTSAQKWVDAAANAVGKSGVWVPGQTANNVAITDLTGGGANETSTSKGTVVAGPAGFTETIGGGGTVSNFAGKISLSTSAKATAAVTRPMAGKLSTSSSAKATSTVTRSFAGKVPVSTSAKATLRRSVVMGGKLPTATNAKATVTRSVTMGGKLPTATSAKASLARSVTLAGKVPVATSAKATMSRTVSMAGKIPVVFSIKGDLSVTSPGTVVVEFGGRIALATGASAILAVMRPMAGKVPLATTATGALQRSVPFGGSVPLATSGRASLTRITALHGKVNLATSAKPASLVRTVNLGGSVPLVTSAKADLKRTLALGGKIALVLHAKGDMSIYLPGPDLGTLVALSVSDQVMVNLILANAIETGFTIGDNVVVTLDTME